VIRDLVETAVEHPVLKVPSYRLHKARGLSVVTIRGRNIYLGRYDSPESRAAYDRVIREFTMSRGVAPSERASLTIAEFVLIYWRHAQTYYPAATLLSTIKPPLKRLRQHCGDQLVAEFRPMRLKVLRQALLDSRDKRGRRLSRRYVNNLIAQIRAFFKWGVGEELVPPSVYQSLQAVDGLRPGRTDAPEPDPVGPQVIMASGQRGRAPKSSLAIVEDSRLQWQTVKQGARFPDHDRESECPGEGGNCGRSAKWLALRQPSHVYSPSDGSVGLQHGQQQRFGALHRRSTRGSPGPRNSPSPGRVSGRLVRGRRTVAPRVRTTPGYGPETHAWRASQPHAAGDSTGARGVRPTGGRGRS